MKMLDVFDKRVYVKRVRKTKLKEFEKRWRKKGLRFFRAYFYDKNYKHIRTAYVNEHMINFKTKSFQVGKNAYVFDESAIYMENESVPICRYFVHMINPIKIMFENKKIQKYVEMPNALTGEIEKVINPQYCIFHLNPSEFETSINENISSNVFTATNKENTEHYRQLIRGYTIMLIFSVIFNVLLILGFIFRK